MHCIDEDWGWGCVWQYTLSLILIVFLKIISNSRHVTMFYLLWYNNPWTSKISCRGLLLILSIHSLPVSWKVRFLRSISDTHAVRLGDYQYFSPTNPVEIEMCAQLNRYCVVCVSILQEDSIVKYVCSRRLCVGMI